MLLNARTRLFARIPVLLLLAGCLLASSPAGAAAMSIDPPDARLADTTDTEASAQGLYYVTDDGVLTSHETGEEVSFFGVNYSPAFAHSYRALHILGKDHEEAIDQDVYHFSRMGLDAYRIHVWDTEISDSLGNLVQNEHLRLHDYTVWSMGERGIRTIITPLTFYDNAYPDGPTPTEGFANYISKREAPLNRDFWPVQKRYLEQFITHVNPYTGLSAIEDPNIIALEIVNEPWHEGPLEDIAEYIDEMADHLRSTGWEKPIFYNISQSPYAAPAVMDADIDGVSFQWYPAGLVGGETIEKNYMPFVDNYPIPWRDEEEFQSKALMVYEFDAADVANSYAYPLMARSFREAGFQWATQFAYDPLGLAHINSDYPTHYLNMVYTPSKAISMLVASEVFRRIPRFEQFDDFPADTLFGDFRVSHSLDLSELNAVEAFIYSHDTQTTPQDESRLERIAGVGSSAVVSYDGSGAYFLDKLEDGIWRLEVMPDAIPVRDPFERPAFDKHVTHIDWREHEMRIDLPDLGGGFDVEALNEGNHLTTTADAGSFTVSPGGYLLTRRGAASGGWTAESEMEQIRLGEFAAVGPTPEEPVVKHTPHEIVDSGRPVSLSANIAGIEPNDTVWLQVNPHVGRPTRVAMEETHAHTFEAELPPELVRGGLLTYWIVIEGDNGSVTFPGNHPGSPTDWDYYHTDRWETPVIDPGSPLELFDARRDYESITLAFPLGSEQYERELQTTDTPGRMGLRVSTEQPTRDREVLGWSLYVADRLSGVSSFTTGAYQNLVVRATTRTELGSNLKVVLVDKDGHSYSAAVPVTEQYEEHRISLRSFEPDTFMLLPRAFPNFMESWFESGHDRTPRAQDIEQIQFLIDTREWAGFEEECYGFEVEAVWLE